MAKASSHKQKHRGTDAGCFAGNVLSAWAARVIEAISGRVPVGSVTYGMESVPSLAALFAPTT